jgi:phosphatidylserine decarboxylase
MSKQLYEIYWMIMTDVCHFLKTDWKVFNNLVEAKAYGLVEELRLNDGRSPVEKAWDGYCYQFFDARQIESVDGHQVTLIS